MKAKPAKIKQNQPKQQPQPQPGGQPENPMAFLKRMIDEVRNENEQSLKKQEAFEKLDNKKQETSKPTGQIRMKSNTQPRQQNQSRQESHRPAISAFSQVAFNSSAGLLTVQINQILFTKLGLELDIGRLNSFKEADIKRIFLLKKEIARLEQQIAMLKAQQELAVEAELINQYADRYKHSNQASRLRI